MADGGQRLLDVIDDPNALESFLGGLTADTELLESAETVDNVVASLARSLDDNEYEVDSPNETLFDTLDSSSNHLTDISSSYVPSDFGHHVAVQNDAFTNNLDGFSNGNNVVIRGSLSQHEQTPVHTSGCDQFIGSSNNNSTIINSVISASSVNSTNNTTVTASNLKQITASVSNCDPSKSTHNFVQAGQLQLTQNSVTSVHNNLNFAFSQDLQHQNHTLGASQTQLNQVTSLSSVSLGGQIQQQQSVPSNSTNNLISVVGSGHENGAGNTLTNTSAATFQVVANQQSAQNKTAHSVVPTNVSQSVSNTASVQVTSGASVAVRNDANTSTISGNNVTLSTSTNVVGSNSTNIASIHQQQQLFAAAGTQQTTVSQLVSGQTVSIPSMTVSAPQLIANSQGGLVATAGQNILQQIQSAGGNQSYITMEQPTALIATGPNAFGATNVALLATGGTPTYAVMPTATQFLTNAIIPQSTIQTLTKTPNGAYLTTGTPQIVTTSNVNALQNVSVVNATSDADSSTLVKTKQPPQLLPKPLSQVSTAVTTNNTSSVTTPSVSSSTEASSSGTGAQPSLSTSSTSAASTSVTDGVVTQLIQQSQAITPQQSFAIGNPASLGQVVASQVSNISTMTTPQQAQLAGTIVMNQYGQHLLLPTASTAQAGLQLILRQQPTQPQVLTIQAPAGTATLSAQQTAQAAATGKPIVRYISQVPQVAQAPGYGLQQIQTPNGPTWVTVRYPQASQASQFSQIQADSIISASSTIQNQISNTGQHLQLQTQQPQQVIQIQQQQAQQLIHHTQQQQIQIQSGLSQATQQQIQGASQLQVQNQQQVTLQSQSQVQLQNQQSQIPNMQVQAQSQQAPASQQSLPQSLAPVDSQSMSAPVQQSPLVSRQMSVMNQSVNHSPQVQISREIEQQQISVPDSSSEPPPPKKAKTKSKSSKKKVTLDLEQLLKQSGIMDEDLQDDSMAFNFDFGSMMDTQQNGLPPSPQIPPAQIPVINTTETPKKSASKKKNSKKSPAQPPPPPPVVLLPPPPATVPSPSAKTKKKSTPKKKNTPSAPPTPPAPLPPPPPPLIVTPTKSKSSKKKSSNNVSGSVIENQKSEVKTAPSKKSAVPPKKVSSMDTMLATIEAVAQSAYANIQSSSPPIPPLPPQPQPITPSHKPTPSPKSKSKSKSKSKTSTPTTPSVKSENLLPPMANSVAVTHPVPVPSVTSSQSMLPTSTLPVSQSYHSVPTSAFTTSTSVSPSTMSPVVSTSRVTGANLTNGSTSVTTSQTGVTRVVQTIQLSPLNQQILRNIQGQIQRLCAIPNRNESEQAALQKLVVLQQQVIATGTPVPNPAHLNNLAQIVNVESISLATSSATVPSSDTPSASSSSSNIPIVSPCESDVTVSPVSSTVVSTTAMPVLANANLINSSSKLNSSKFSGNLGPSPVVTTAASGVGGGSSSGNGAFVIIGSPSVSSTASPDSTSNIANNMSVEQCSVLPSTSTTIATNTAAAINSGGVGNIVVSNVKADLGQLVASLSVTPPEDKNKENTQGKILQGVTPAPIASVPVSTPSSIPFSQHLQHVPPPPMSYAPPSFPARSVLDEKKAEEQRLANLKAEEEKRARWKKEEFEMLLQRDQQYVVKPDYEVPFSSKKDAVERLMKYHIYRDRNDMNFEEFDAEFENNSGILLEKFSVMMSKYRNLLLKESTKEVGCAERVMLERMFVSEEKVRLEQDRIMIAQGDVLELPPPPESWIPQIKEMVDKEMIEFEPQDPVVSQQVQSAVDSIMGCESNDASNYILEEGDKIEYDAFGVPITSSGYAGLGAASSADIDEAVRSILT